MGAAAARRVSPKPAAAASSGADSGLNSILNQKGKSDQEKAAELVAALQSGGGSMADQMSQLLGMIGMVKTELDEAKEK